MTKYTSTGFGAWDENGKFYVIPETIELTEEQELETGLEKPRGKPPNQGFSGRKYLQEEFPYVVWDTELSNAYSELGQALREMMHFEQEDEWRIEVPVYQAANAVAAELSARAIPVPQVFSHGPKSVVFNWTHGEDNIYLTISSDMFSALISCRQRIKRRLEMPVAAASIFPLVSLIQAILER